MHPPSRHGWWDHRERGTLLPVCKYQLGRYRSFCQERLVRYCLITTLAGLLGWRCLFSVTYTRCGVRACEMVDMLVSSDGPLGTRVSILSRHIQHSLHWNNVSRQVLKTLPVTCQIVSKRFVTCLERNLSRTCQKTLTCQGIK